MDTRLRKGLLNSLIIMLLIIGLAFSEFTALIKAEEEPFDALELNFGSNLNAYDEDSPEANLGDQGEYTFSLDENPDAELEPGGFSDPQTPPENSSLTAASEDTLEFIDPGQSPELEGVPPYEFAETLDVYEGQFFEGVNFGTNQALEAQEPHDLEENQEQEESALRGDPVLEITFVKKDNTEEKVTFYDKNAEIGLRGTPEKARFWFFISYFIGWSDNKNYIEEGTGHLFYEGYKVQDLLDAGIESGSKLYALYANTALRDAFAKNASLRINDAVEPADFVSPGTSERISDTTTVEYVSTAGDYEINKLEAVFQVNPFVAAAVYKDPWVGALENGSDWGALSKKKGTITVVDLHVSIDKRLVLPEEFNLTFHSYTFRPYKVYAAKRADGTPVAEYEIYPYLGVDQTGERPGDGVVNCIEDNNPNTTFKVKSYQVDASGNHVPVHDFVIRTRIRTGYDRWGNKIPADMEQIQSPMKLSLSAGSFRLGNSQAGKIAAKQADPIKISGFVDGLVKGVYFGPINSETEILNFETTAATLIFDPNGGSWDDGTTSLRTETAQPDESIRIKPAPSKTGFNFLYWECEGIRYNPGDIYRVADNLTHTFTAKYQEIINAEKVILTFDPAGGFWDDGSNVPRYVEAKIGDVILILDAPSKPGASFLYWEGSKYFPGDSYEVTGAHTFLAIYEQNITPDDENSSGDQFNHISTNHPTKVEDIIYDDSCDIVPAQMVQALPRTGEDRSLYNSALLLVSLAGFLFICRRHLR